jgi:hypothetical protein
MDVAVIDVPAVGAFRIAAAGEVLIGVMGSRRRSAS